MSTPDRVIVYGLPPDKAQHNARIGHVRSYHSKGKTYLVAFPDGSTVAVKRNNLFYAERTAQYFDAPVDTLPRIEDCVAVHRGPRGPSVVATAAVPAGTLLRANTFQLVMTDAQVKAIEAGFETMVRTDLFRLMGRPAGSGPIAFGTNYSAGCVFVGAAASASENPTIEGLLLHNSTSPESLELEWRRSSGPELLWLLYWIRTLAHLTPLQVFSIWHMVRKDPWPTPDRRTLIFSDTICQMECPQLRLDQYQKVMDGLQDAEDDPLKDLYLSTAMMSPPGGKYMTLYTMTDIQVGHVWKMDYGIGFVSPLCDTIFNIIFMNPVERLEWYTLYKNILGFVGRGVVQHFEKYVRLNFERLQCSEKPPTVRQAPAVLVPLQPTHTDMPACAQCLKGMQRPLVCARCKLTQYCSRACQVAAWKTHKKKCQPPAGAN